MKLKHFFTETVLRLNLRPLFTGSWILLIENLSGGACWEGLIEGINLKVCHVKKNCGSGWGCSPVIKHLSTTAITKW